MGELYPQIKWIHISCVILSGGLFALRGVFALTDSVYSGHPLLRRLSYVIDTTLLAAALWLASIIHQWPFAEAWLTAKVLLVMAYIAFGLVALRRGNTRFVRVACFVVAIIIYCFIVSVALTHNPRGLLLFM